MERGVIDVFLSLGWNPLSHRKVISHLGRVLLPRRSACHLPIIPSEGPTEHEENENKMIPPHMSISVSLPDRSDHTPTSTNNGRGDWFLHVCCLDLHICSTSEPWLWHSSALIALPGNFSTLLQWRSKLLNFILGNISTSCPDSVSDNL